MTSILLIEPWMAGSHRLWAEGYARASRFDVSVVGLPEGPWRWRLRAGGLPLAGLVEHHISQHGAPDVVVVSGLVDVSQLLGLTRRALPPSVPIVVYQHESQLIYPTSRGGVNDDAVLRNWHSWCVADLVLFNSAFHRAALAEALPEFLARQPEDDQAHALAGVLASFEVMPVGVDLPASSNRSGPVPTILWPHRWDSDKAPEEFEAAVVELDEAGVEFGLVLAGEEGLVPSEERDRLARRFPHRIVAAGPFSRTDYLAWLRRSDIVVSCAHHEFFGLAVVEAMAAGCLPVLPDRLSYPEIVPHRYHSAVLYRAGEFGPALTRAVTELPAQRRAIDGLAESMTRYSWPVVAPALDDRLAQLVA